MAWTFFNDSCSWHAGWFGKSTPYRQFSVQHIRDFVWNFDVCWGERHDWRLSIRQRGFVSLGRHMEHGRGVRLENSGR